MYLPKTKYKTSNASQRDGLVDSTGTLYQGPYFETVTGELYSGATPSKDSKSLKRSTGPDQTTNTLGYLTPPGRTVYDRVRKDPVEEQLKETLEVPRHYPRPTSSTSFTRYFAIEKITARVIEVSKDVYLSMKSKEPKYYYPKYELITLEWSLTNPTENRINIAVAKLDNYLKDPSQFVR